ncbi:DUF3649 domain-containing protein [Variovorax sp. PAMC26660]|uniref:DUF3649 domain-containing protein n=1 Tax=Variovorax sp. PAMC26660 TaxID=2762322 RepID=UPI00164DB1FA|nr:DUF3649 domain-containing protein [Variovorax sp. PAMC26660]QNK70245.1 DUF3649 domain-containing protein [Variovorax sp. PAMC26660]
MSIILILLIFFPFHEFPNDLVRRPARVVTTGVRYRLSVASRAIAAIAGGYGVAALSSAVLALCLPAAFGMARSEAAMTGTLASFIVFALAVMWVFAARTAWRAWSGLAIAAVPLGLLLLLLIRITGSRA